MAELSKITLPNGTTVDLKDAKKTGIYPVIGTQTASTGSWTGAIDVASLYAGLTIAYALPYAGSGNATLNLTLSGGTTTGAKNCYYNTSRLSTQYPAGATIIMTYWPAGSITVGGTATTDDRWITTSIVTGVKGDEESSYRMGNVNITKANIGLGNVDNTADADKNVKTAKYRMPMVLGSNFDLNALSDQSTYPSEVYNGVSALNCNFPIEVAGHAFVIDVSRTAFTSGSDEYMRMLAYDVTDQKYYIRSYSTTTSTWSDWHDITLDLNVQSIANTTDLNTLTETGNYFSYAHGGSQNFPSTLTANHMALISVLSYDYNGDYISQTVTDLRTGDTYVRGRTANFGWTSWMPSTLSGTSPISVSGKGVVSHDDSGATAGSYGDSSAQTPTYGGTFKVPYVTVDAKGHVTGISDHTVKIPASDNTNTTYTFANGTNGFTVTPSDGTAQTVTVTPSIAEATTSTAGLMSAADKTKLNGIATGAEVNQNAFSNVTVGNTTVAADAKTDTLTLVAGSNVTITPDATNDKITFAATDTTYSVATTTEDGLMSTSDRAFLNDLSYPAYLNGAEVPKGDADNTEKVTTYATCATAASTTAKTVNTGWDFGLYEGAMVFVKFTVTNTGAVGSLTLDVNSTGAKSIKYRGGNLPAAGTLAANRVYAFVYDGTNWELLGDLDTDSNTNTWRNITVNGTSWKGTGTNTGAENYVNGSGISISASGNDLTIAHSNSVTAGTAGTSSATSGSSLDVPYVTYDAEGHVTASGTHTHTVTGFLTSHQTIKQEGVTGATANRYASCSTAAATAAKTASITTGTFALETGATVYVKFTYTNTASTPTLNINSTGAKNIRYRGSNLTGTLVDLLYAGEVIGFVYDGSYWNILTPNGDHRVYLGAEVSSPSSADHPIPYYPSTSTTTDTFAYLVMQPGFSYDPSDGNLKVTKINGSAVGSSPQFTDTKNTAGSTNSSSKLFLVGATSQAANPQTYSNSNVYATNGVINATSYDVAATAHISYDSTEKAILFTFS